MSEASKGDFAPFLNELEKRTSSPAASSEAVSPLRILSFLVERAMPLGELQQASGLSFEEFAPTLRSLQAADYVTVSGEPSEEIAELTSEGRKVAQIASS
jgi:hypothetical protein